MVVDISTVLTPVLRLYCFMCSCRIEYGISFYVSLVAPMVLIMAANISVFVAVSLVLARKGKSSGKKQEKKQLMRISISLSIILGLTWVSGLTVLGNTNPAPQWIFTILVAFQGLFLFIFQVASHRTIRKLAASTIPSLAAPSTRPTPLSSGTLKSGDITSSGTGTYDGRRRRSSFPLMILDRFRRTSSVDKDGSTYSSSPSGTMRSRGEAEFNSSTLDSGSEPVSAWDPQPAKKSYALKEMKNMNKKGPMARVREDSVESEESCSTPPPGRRRSSATTTLSRTDISTLEREARVRSLQRAETPGSGAESESKPEGTPVKKTFAQRAKEMRERQVREAGGKSKDRLPKQATIPREDAGDVGKGKTSDNLKKMTFGERAAAMRRERMQASKSGSLVKQEKVNKKKKKFERQAPVVSVTDAAADSTVYVNVPTEDLDAERSSPVETLTYTKRPLSMVDELRPSVPKAHVFVNLDSIKADNLTKDERQAAAKKLKDDSPSDKQHRVARSSSTRSNNSVLSSATSPMSLHRENSLRQSGSSNRRGYDDTDDERFTPAPARTPDSEETEEDQL